MPFVKLNLSQAGKGSGELKLRNRTLLAVFVTGSIVLLWHHHDLRKRQNLYTRRQKRARRMTRYSHSCLWRSSERRVEHSSCTQ